MTDQLKQAAQQALEALEELDGLDTETECVTIDVGDVITALRTALEQQAEPVCPECKAAVLYECVACSSNNYPPQQQAEPPPEWPLIKNILVEYGLDAIAFVAAWKAAQQQAEPVAVKHGVINMENFVGSGKPVVFNDPTAPPQRQWVGLTDEEATKIWESTDDKDSWELLKRVEAKLKERNT